MLETLYYLYYYTLYYIGLNIIEIKSLL